MYSSSLFSLIKLAYVTPLYRIMKGFLFIFQFTVFAASPVSVKLSTLKIQSRHLLSHCYAFCRFWKHWHFTNTKLTRQLRRRIGCINTTQTCHCSLSSLIQWRLRALTKEERAVGSVRVTVLQFRWAGQGWGCWTAEASMKRSTGASGQAGSSWSGRGESLVLYASSSRRGLWRL